MNFIANGIAPGILIFNPISLSIIITAGIFAYNCLLLAVCIFGITKGIQQFILDELGVYLDNRTIEKIKNFKIYELKKTVCTLQDSYICMSVWNPIVYSIFNITWTSVESSIFRLIIGQIKLL